MNQTINFGEKHEHYGYDRLSLVPYQSDNLKGVSMMNIFTRQCTLTIHQVTPSQLREMAAAFNAMADALQTVNLETV